jgi:hypothetical protein
MIVGAIIGALIGILAAMQMLTDYGVDLLGHAVIYFILFVFGFASLGTILKNISAVFKDNEGGLFSWIFAIGVIIASPIISIYRFIKRINQIKQCDEIIANDERTLQEMRDYFAYTQVIEKQAGAVDLAKLANQGGELFNNTYAQSVMKNGEKAAQAELRQSVVTISANGEIIRSFTEADKPKKKAA